MTIIEEDLINVQSGLVRGRGNATDSKNAHSGRAVTPAVELRLTKAEASRPSNPEFSRACCILKAELLPYHFLSQQTLVLFS